MSIFYVSGSHNRNIFHAATLSLICDIVSRLVVVISTPMNYILHYAKNLIITHGVAHVHYIVTYKVCIRLSD